MDKVRNLSKTPMRRINVSLPKRKLDDSQTVKKESPKTTQKEIDNSLEYLSSLGQAALLQYRQDLEEPEIVSKTASVDSLPGVILYIDAPEADSFASAIYMGKILKDQKIQKELEAQIQREKMLSEAQEEQPFVSDLKPADIDEFSKKRDEIERDSSFDEDIEEIFIDDIDRDSSFDEDAEEIFMDDEPYPCNSNHCKDEKLPSDSDSEEEYETITITEEDF